MLNYKFNSYFYVIEPHTTPAPIPCFENLLDADLISSQTLNDNGQQDSGSGIFTVDFNSQVQGMLNLDIRTEFVESVDVRALEIGIAGVDGNVKLKYDVTLVQVNGGGDQVLETDVVRIDLFGGIS